MANRDEFELAMARIGGGGVIPQGTVVTSTRGTALPPPPPPVSKLAPIEYSYDVVMPKNVAVTMVNDKIEGDFRLNDAQKNALLQSADQIYGLLIKAKIDLPKEVLDINGDGKVSVQELGAVLAAYGTRDTAVINKDGKGTVTVEKLFVVGDNIGGDIGILTKAADGTTIDSVGKNPLTTAQVRSIAVQIMEQNEMGNLDRPALPIQFKKDGIGNTR